MDPVTITALIIGIISAIGGAIAHMRIRSNCGSFKCASNPEDIDFTADLGPVEKSLDDLEDSES